MRPSRGGKGKSEDLVGYSPDILKDEEKLDDAQKALMELIQTGEYRELLLQMKNEPAMAAEMEKSLASSGMSWEDLQTSLDLMAEGKGPSLPGSAPFPVGSKPSASGSKGVKAAPSSAKPSAPPGSIVVAPIPAFVVKSVNKIATKTYPEGIKVFINFCHSPDMFAPPPLSEPIQSIVDKEVDFEYRVPIAVGAPRAGLDKAGKACIEIDACLNSSVLDLAENDLDYQSFLIELVAENVEEQIGLALSRDFSMPKMKAKGVIGKISVRPPVNYSKSPPAAAKKGASAVGSMANAPKPSTTITSNPSSMSGPRIVELEDDVTIVPKPAPSAPPPKSILKPTVSPAEGQKPSPISAAPTVAPAKAAKPGVAETVMERTVPKAAISEIVTERAPPAPSVKSQAKSAPAKPPVVQASKEPKYSVRVTGAAPARKLELEIELPDMVGSFI
jgi:hypothetical protein